MAPRLNRHKMGPCAFVVRALWFVIVCELMRGHSSDAQTLRGSRSANQRISSGGSEIGGDSGGYGGAGDVEGKSRLTFMAESDEFLTMTSPGRRRLVTSNIFDVTSYPNTGPKQDASFAFTRAFKDACAYTAANPNMRATVRVPRGTTLYSRPFSVNPAGPQENSRCARVTFQNDGVITAPSRIADWGPLVRSAFISIWGMDDFDLVGGVYLGHGEEWWRTCESGCSGYKTRPKFISFGGCTNVYISGLTIRNPPQFHIMVDGGNNVLVEHIRLYAPPESHNTDGVHLSRVFNVVVRRNRIETGDDCVVVQTDSHDILIHSTECIGTHGVSIGSLGSRGGQSCVKDIEVRDITFTDCENGARIKSWAGGKGAVKDVVFRNLTMTRVKFPIKIDQSYGDRTYGSGNVAVFNVTFQEIRGTAVGAEGIFLACDPDMPCGASFFDIDIKAAPGSQYPNLVPLSIAAHGTQRQVSPPIRGLSTREPNLTGPISEANTCGYEMGRGYSRSYAFTRESTYGPPRSGNRGRQRVARGRNWGWRRKSGYNVGRGTLGTERNVRVESQWQRSGSMFTITYRIRVQRNTGWDLRCDRFVASNFSVPVGSKSSCVQSTKLPANAYAVQAPRWGWGLNFFAFFKTLETKDCSITTSIQFMAATHPKMGTVWVRVTDSETQRVRSNWTQVPAFVPNC